MADNTTLAAILFPDTFRANEFLTATSRLTSQGHLLVQDAVFIVKDEDGKTDVKETTDLEVGGAAATGGLWTGLFGLLLGGPIGMVVAGGIGAGVGALTAKAVDLGVKDEFIAELKDSVRPGTTTLALLLSHIDEGPLRAELERFPGARLVAGHLPPGVLDAARVLSEATPG